MILFDSEDSFLNLEGQFVGVSIWSSSTILKPQKTNIFISIKDLGREVLLLIGDVRPFDHTLSKAFGSLPKCLKCVTYVSGIFCNLCVGKLKLL